jgi:hypothetical protein
VADVDTRMWPTLVLVREKTQRKQSGCLVDVVLE